MFPLIFFSFLFIILSYISYYFIYYIYLQQHLSACLKSLSAQFFNNISKNPCLSITDERISNCMSVISDEIILPGELKSVVKTAGHSNPIYIIVSVVVD